MNIAFVTGARSEYGIMRRVIKEICSDKDFHVSIVATGMHFQHKYGYTINEIHKDNLARIIEAPCYVEEERQKERDFVDLIEVLYSVFSIHRFDAIYIIGDRLEAYAAALAAHFMKIPVIHFAGGQITNGAVDNIYRYNISNLSSVHLVTNLYAKQRLESIPIIDKSKIYLVGSSAVDSIKSYLKTPQDISKYINGLEFGNFVLMTFHSETKGIAAKNSIPEVMDSCISELLASGLKILITYPNNDDGSEDIIKVIKKWELKSNIFVRKNLGADLYYIAANNCLFVIGNSSSGIIEIPYFQKYTLNIGSRQSGRNAPKSVISIPADFQRVLPILKKMVHSPLCSLPQEYIYGDGNSISKIHSVIKDNFIHD